MKALFSYKQRRLPSDLVNTIMARRLDSMSPAYNANRRGKMAIFANDHIGIQINQHGLYEKLALDLLFTFLKPLEAELKAGVALDIGANIGNHALVFADHFRTVHAFEPGPPAFALLKFNSALADNIIVHNLGLGDVAGQFQLNQNFENMAAASIKHAGQDDRSATIEVETLDTVAANLADIMFMKIDVEGFEPNVLRGGKETIRRNQPLIMFEQWETEFSNGTTESISLLAEEGYRFCWPVKRHEGKRSLSRKLFTLWDALVARSTHYDMVTAETVPPRKYEMLIAVPRHLHGRLGLS